MVGDILQNSTRKLNLTVYKLKQKALFCQTRPCTACTLCTMHQLIFNCIYMEYVYTICE